MYEPTRDGICTFSLTNCVMVDAQFCSDLILETESVDGCSGCSLIQMDPSEVPDGAGPWLSKQPLQLSLVVAATSFTGTFGLELITFPPRRGYSTLDGKWLSSEAQSEDDISRGGLDTITYS